jgi:hypothetical protein
MKVKPLLGDWEVPHIAAIESLEHRDFAELDVPGRRGSVFQDMDARPTRIALRGSLFGDEVRDTFFEEVRGRFQAGEPLTFVADITTATDVQYVLIETMHFAEAGTAPDETRYLIVLTESPPPPPPPDPLGGIDTGLLDQAAGFLDTVAGALDALDLLAMPDLQDPTPPLQGILNGVTGALGGLSGLGDAVTELFGDGG